MHSLSSFRWPPRTSFCPRESSDFHSLWHAASLAANLLTSNRSTLLGDLSDQRLLANYTVGTLENSLVGIPSVAPACLALNYLQFTKCTEFAPGDILSYAHQMGNTFARSAKESSRPAKTDHPVATARVDEK